MTSPISNPLPISSTASSKLLPYWRAWQEGSMDGRDPEVTASKALFQAIMAAVRSDAHKAPDDFEPEIQWIEGQHEAMLEYLLQRGVERNDTGFLLSRGIGDWQALEAIQSLVATGEWMLPPNALMSYSYSDQAARGFAWKSAWGGIAINSRIPASEILLVPEAIWGHPENLDREQEVLVRPANAIRVTNDDILAVNKGQVPTDALKRQTQKEIQEKFSHWLQTSKLRHEDLGRIFPGYDFG